MKKTKGFGLFEIIIIIVITALITSISTGIIMLNFLGDKYTTYLNDKEYQSIIDDLSGTYNGIGVYIELNKVIQVIDNSPAQKAGIVAGDIITKINGNDVTNSSASDIKDLIKDKNNKYLNLEIKRNNEILIFNIEKELLVNPSITADIIADTQIGYIKIDKFSENLKDQVSEALGKLESKNITGLIIDVRGNAGGYLTAAEDVASLFIEKGKMIYSLEANNNRINYADKTDEKRNYPIVTIINGGSASASEILVAALKDSYGASIVGTKSYGKGKVQQVVSLYNGDSVKYTSAKWLTPLGICIDGIGITPDYNITNEEEVNTDFQLEKAIELLK